MSNEPEKKITISPNGHYVLIEALEVKSVSEGGIILGDVAREQMACEFGIIKEFGPTAFVGISGCNPAEYPPGDDRYNMQPYQLWGLNVGDQVEYQRLEGKATGVKNIGNLRYIPDVKIIEKVKGAISIDKSRF